MIKFEDILRYNSNYNNILENKKIENIIKKDGLYEACISQQIIEGTPTDFNIELEENSLYDQKDGLTCWIVSTLDFIKNNFTDEKIDLSVNYIQFFHRLEKMNKLYEIIINNNFTIDDINKKNLIKNHIGIFGVFDSITEIIEKYGIVPDNIMPMNINNYKNPYIVDKLLTEKVINDVFRILEIKENYNNNLEEIKCKFNEENYVILSKIFGNPPVKFNFNYNNSNLEEDISPIEFANKYIKKYLNEYVLIRNDNNKEFNKKYIVEDTINSIYEKKIEYINLPIEQIERIAINQLKDNLPVWFGCDFKTVSGTYENYSGILDKNLYDYNKMLGINILSKDLKLKFNNINYEHAMLITGVKIIDDKPVVWKVKNSYGDKYNKKGYFVMTNDYFDNFVIMLQVNKKYLGDSVIN